MDKLALPMLLNELCSHSTETEWLEFKENNAVPETIGEYISALANSASLHDKRAAYLIFGVDDKDHNIVGTKFRPSEAKIGNEEFQSWLARLLTPRSDFYIEELDVDGKHVVVFVVDPANNRPILFKNTAFIRIGYYKKKLADYPEKERKIWNKQNKVVFEEEIAQSKCSEDDVLCLLSYSDYFRLLNLSLPSNKQGILAKMVEEDFISRSNQSSYNITNLGAILFANSLEDFKYLKRKALRVVVYKKNDRLNTVKEWICDKGYAIGYPQMVDYITDQLPQNEIIKQATRQQVKMYPDIAIRELVANVLIHQDFSQQGTGPMVEIFQDRIEITNPGAPLINTLRFIDHAPKSRNEQLASLFRRIEYCEERGSGIDKIVSAVESYQLPAPDFISDDDYLRAIIYAHKSLRSMGKKGKIRACYQHVCLKYVSGDVASNRSLRERFAVSEQNYSVISRIIADTVAAGLIKLSDPDSKAKRHASYIPFWA